VSRVTSSALALAAILALAGGGVSAGATDASTTAGAADPLKGQWDTGKIAMSRVRAAVKAAGYSNADFDGFLKVIGQRTAKSWETNLVFYRVVREGDAPYVKVTGWDPTKSAMPRDGDHGPYKLLSNHRVLITSADPQTNHDRDTYSFRVSGSTLTLRALTHVDPTVSKAEQRLEKILLYVIAAAPFTRTK
jgi:hypothetical protein